MAVIHQLAPVPAREDRFTWLGAPMPDGTRKTFRGPDAHAVVQAWLRAWADLEAQMPVLRQTVRRLEMVLYSRRRRATLKAHGICQCCGVEDAEPGRTLCWRCRLYRNQRRSGARPAPPSPYKNGRRAG